MDEDEFDRMISNFTPEMVDYLGGIQGMSNEEAAEIVRDLEIKSEGNNLYVPRQAGQTLINNDGGVFEIVVDDRLRAMATREFTRTAPGRTRSRVRQEQLEQQEAMP